MQDDDSSERTYNSNRSVESTREEIPFSVGTSFGEHLKAQIYLTKMNKEERHSAKFVVGNIDADGYLRRSIEELVDDLSFKESLYVPDSKMKEIVEQVKQFEPAGVGAFDLQECLLIQLKNKVQTEEVKLATLILTKCFDSFSHKHHKKILHQLNITEDQLESAIAEIVHLNPKPGSCWNGTVYDRNQSVITPDFIVEQEDEEFVISLNQGDIPPLHISCEYNQMLEAYSHNGKHSSADKENSRVLRNYVDSAKWFIEAIQKRNETLIQTMRAIVAHQREFFLNGDTAYLKPMVLKDISDRIGVDVSTASRACSDKYVQTQFGIYPLKFFFSEATTNKNGEEITTREIKQRLRALVDGEDKRHPITDDELVEKLHEDGYTIARRTVAKYREKMGIPVARLRQQMK